jgi:nucleoside-diphosphate-sugar epimerase
MILLTGSTGFLGSRILATLLEKGNEVVIVKRSFSNTGKIAKYLPHEKLHIFDIDCNDPRDLFEKYSIKTIIHTATEYGRGEAPVFKILEANLILPIRLAELGIDYGVKCFINTDSFFNKGNSSYSNLLNYSLSKKSLLVWLNQLSKKLKIINVVLEHIYGPDDDGLKFVESVIQKIAVEKAPKISLTHGHQKRDFVYIDDVVDAYVKLIEYADSHDFVFKTFEVGTGNSYQIRDLVKIIKDVSNSPTELGFGDIEYRSDEIMDSKADISQLCELNWMPTTSLKDGIVKILKKYNAVIQNKNAI